MFLAELFRDVADEGLIEIVAAEIGIALEEIYRIKSRMLKRLREIIGEVERTWAD